MDEPFVYVVVKQGVYKQGVFGPFFTLDAAQNAAAWHATNDDDAYHTWDIWTLSHAGLGENLGSCSKATFHPDAPRDFTERRKRERETEAAKTETDKGTDAASSGPDGAGHPDRSEVPETVEHGGRTLPPGIRPAR